ncbi:MAG: hypothetical protein P1U40_09880 [Coxiellaceae bacterium]|nr:hypothetical protein [Coxiellaceae bacterium]
MRTNQKTLNKNTLFKIKTIVTMEFNYWISDNKDSLAVNNLVRVLRDGIPLVGEQYDLFQITWHMLRNPEQAIKKGFKMRLAPEQEQDVRQIVLTTLYSEVKGLGKEYQSNDLADLKSQINRNIRQLPTELKPEIKPLTSFEERLRLFTYRSMRYAHFIIFPVSLVTMMASKALLLMADPNDENGKKLQVAMWLLYNKPKISLVTSTTFIVVMLSSVIFFNCCRRIPQRRIERLSTPIESDTEDNEENNETNENESKMAMKKNA